jgi:hypothetical protein
MNDYNVPAESVIPNFIGTLPTISNKKLETILEEPIPDDVTIILPASGVLLEYIEGAARASLEVTTHAIAKEALRGQTGIPYPR